MLPHALLQCEGDLSRLLFGLRLQSAQINFQAFDLFQQLIQGQTDATAGGFAAQDARQNPVHSPSHRRILEVASDHVLVERRDVTNDAILIKVLNLASIVLGITPVEGRLGPIADSGIARCSIHAAIKNPCGSVGTAGVLPLGTINAGPAFFLNFHLETLCVWSHKIRLIDRQLYSIRTPLTEV